MIGTLNAEQGWRLTANQQRAHLAALTALGRLPADAGKLRRLVHNYHHDHQQVAALSDSANPQHHDAWRDWVDKAARILHTKQQIGQRDLLGSAEDLVQVALEDLVRALPSFRYASRLSTWAFAVIAHSAQRYTRDLHAAKRNGQTEPIELSAAQWYAAPAQGEPASVAEIEALVALIDALLAAAPDPRWQTIFRLWVHQDLRLIDIARQLRLSQSRVSRMLTQLTALLREHPEIRAWLDQAALDERERGSRADPPGQAYNSGESLQIE